MEDRCRGPSGGLERDLGVRGRSMGTPVCAWLESPCDECDGFPLGPGASGSGQWGLVLEAGFLRGYTAQVLWFEQLGREGC